MASARRPRTQVAGRPRPRAQRLPEARIRPRAPPPLVGEEPHAHIVCRVCGRIQGLDLSELDRHLLTELAALTPDGWTVERIAYSLAGACRRCREGPAAP